MDPLSPYPNEVPRLSPYRRGEPYIASLSSRDTGSNHRQYSSLHSEPAFLAVNSPRKYLSPSQVSYSGKPSSPIYSSMEVVDSSQELRPPLRPSPIPPTSLLHYEQLSSEISAPKHISGIVDEGLEVSTAPAAPVLLNVHHNFVSLKFGGQARMFRIYRMLLSRDYSFGRVGEHYATIYLGRSGSFMDKDINAGHSYSYRVAEWMEDEKKWSFPSLEVVVNIPTARGSLLLPANAPIVHNRMVSWNAEILRVRHESDLDEVKVLFWDSRKSSEEILHTVYASASLGHVNIPTNLLVASPAAHYNTALQLRRKDDWSTIGVATIFAVEEMSPSNPVKPH
jgi:hypothetical protein